ncbi:MAG: response regulator [Lachnospiraceae bacterium]|nr:response regulator [Lachnospiraceae bacterium]
MLKRRNEAHKAMYLRIVAAIIAITVVIIVFSLAMGTRFLRNNLSTSIEHDLLAVADMADKYLSAEIRILKMMTADAARDVDLVYQVGEDMEAVLAYFYEAYPVFISLAIYSESALVASFGDIILPERLYRESFMESAFAGNQGISTTKRVAYSPLVMYVSAPMRDGFVLAVAISGHYFNDLMDGFRIYESGHVFVDDAEGVMIVNYHRDWVDTRMNLIELSKVDSAYEGAAEVRLRGLAGERGIGHYSIGGEPRFVAFRPITASNEGWFLGVVTPKAESPLREVPGGMTLIGAIALVLGVITSLIAAIIIKKPYDEVDRLRKVAEEASLTKSRFLANMSHEMRTPLNVVVGLTDLMLMEDTVKDHSDYVKKIRTAGLTLLSIVNGILDISKIESGKLELTPVDYDTASLINDAITLNVLRIGEKPITFALDIEASLFATLHGDDLRVKQILNNLLSNALKYTRKGMVSLCIRAEMAGRNQVWLDIAVCDTGIGIRESDMAKLFTDYSQVDTKANRRIEGTGLGLSITKRLVELMDGSIEVESEYGKGSAFRVRIKQGFVNDVTLGATLVEKLQKFQYIEEKRDDAGKLQPIDLSYANVLVVDDFRTNLDVAKGLLERYKLQVDCVTTGQEAIVRIKNAKPIYAAVFMDYMMPEMDGIEVMKEIRGLGSSYAEEIPVIALTANAISGNKEMFCKHGFQGFLAKPIDIAELDGILRKWVRDELQEVKKSVPGSTDMRMLVVDDNQTNLDMARVLIGRHKNIKVDCVTSGQEAVVRMQEEKFMYAMIFMDYNMPGMDGLETAEKIRGLGSLYAKEIPMIALTGDATKETEEMFYRHGFQGFLAKPLDIARLDAILRPLL